MSSSGIAACFFNLLSMFSHKMSTKGMHAHTIAGWPLLYTRDLVVIESALKDKFNERENVAA